MSPYLPQLDDHQLARQIQYLLDEGFVPAIEYVRQPDPHNHYWDCLLYTSPSPRD